MPTSVVSLASVAILGAAIHAQTCTYVPDANTTGGSNVIPFGHQLPNNATWSNQKYQTLIPTSTLGNLPGRICEMAFVPTTSGLRQFKTIKVQLNHTTATALGTTFAANLGSNATTVLDSHDYYWPSTASQWNRIGFQKAFLYIPARGNVVLDIEVTGAGMPDSTSAHAGCASVAWFRLYAFGWTGSPPPTGQSDTAAGLRMELCFDTNDASAFGIGCNGSNNQAPQLSYSGSAKLGGSVKVDMAQGLPSRPVLLLLGFTSSLPFPIDLRPIGAPQCWLYTSPDLAAALVTNASGGTSATLAIPNDAGLVCALVYQQFVPVDPAANQLGLAFSNYGRLLLGH